MIHFASISMLQIWYHYMNLEQNITNIKGKASKSFYTKKLAKATGFLVRDRLERPSINLWGMWLKSGCVPQSKS